MQQNYGETNHTTVGVGGQKISCARFGKKYSVLQKFLNTYHQ